MMDLNKQENGGNALVSILVALISRSARSMGRRERCDAGRQVDMETEVIGKYGIQW
jgi:hypothetical protein